MSFDTDRKPIPFGQGSVSVGLYRHDLSTPPEMFEALRRQSAAVIEAGFDGVTISEHHAGFYGYMPNPLQVVGLLLQAASRGWAAPLPTILPLRSTALLIEDIAWLAAAFPGRVGVGLAPGYVFEDFSICGADFGGRWAHHWEEVRTIVESLAGGAAPSLANDPAVAWVPQVPVPILAASSGLRSMERAGQAGVGIALAEFDGRRGGSRVEAYRAAGGRGPIAIIRFVWLGDVPQIHITQWKEIYGQRGADRSWRGDQSAFLIRDNEPRALAEQLATIVRDEGGTCVNLRFHLPGMSPTAIEEQILRFGETVLPPLRSFLDSQTRHGRQ